MKPSPAFINAGHAGLPSKRSTVSGGVTSVTGSAGSTGRMPSQRSTWDSAVLEDRKMQQKNVQKTV